MVPTNTRKAIQWPPYYPGSIAQLGEWYEPDEILSSDMPWAVAWYANRKCVWVPDKVETFMDMNDYTRLGGPIVGLYLTPVTGDGSLFTDIVRGEYKEWSSFILRNVGTRGFPLQAVTQLQIEGECVLYSDRDRWSTKSE